MAAPIPSAYTTGYNNGYPLLYIVRLAPAGGSVMYLTNVQETIVSISLPRTISYDGVNLTEGQLYRGYLAAEVNEQSINGMGEIDFNFPLNDLGGLAGRNEMTIRLLNQGLLSDTLMLYDIDNTPIEVWQGYLPPTGGIVIDGHCLLLFKGVVYEWETWDHNILTLQCYDDRHLVDVKMPRIVIERETHPRAPEGSLGRGIPVLFGDFETVNTATYGGRASYEVGLYDVAPGIITDKTGVNCYVSSEPWDEPQDRVYYAEPDQPYTARLAPADVTDSMDGDVGYVKIKGEAAAAVYVYPLQVSVRSNVSNPENAIDSDPSTSVYIPPTGTLALQIGQFTPPGILAPDAIGAGINDYIIHVDVVSLIDSMTLTVRRIHSGTEGSPQALSVGHNQINMTGGDTWEDMYDREFKIECPLTGSGYVSQVWIETRSRLDLTKTVTTYEPRGGPVSSYGSWYGLPLIPPKGFYTNERIEYHEGKTSLYFSAKGALYGSWITAGGRSAGYSPGDLIHNPAHAMEFILREVMSEPTSRIDTASFDAVGHASTGSRKDWLLDSSVSRVDLATEHLRQIAREYGLILYQDPNDGAQELRWRVVALPTTSSAVDLEITESLIHADIETGFPTLFIAGYTPQQAVVNDLRVAYRKNYVSGNYQRSRYISDVTNVGSLSSNLDSQSGAPRGATYTGWLAESQTKYNIVREGQFNLDYIRDDATAERHLKLFADWFAFRRVTLKINLIRNLSTLALRIGDVVTVTTSLLGTNHSGVSKFLITRTNYPPVSYSCPPYITIECEEIPSNITGARVASLFFDRYSFYTS